MSRTFTARLVAAPAATAARPCSLHGYQWCAQADLGMNPAFMDDITTSKRHARRLGKRAT